MPVSIAPAREQNRRILQDVHGVCAKRCRETALASVHIQRSIQKFDGLYTLPEASVWDAGSVANFCTSSTRQHSHSLHDMPQGFHIPPRGTFSISLPDCLPIGAIRASFAVDCLQFLVPCGFHIHPMAANFFAFIYLGSTHFVPAFVPHALCKCRWSVCSFSDVAWQLTCVCFAECGIGLCLELSNRPGPSIPATRIALPTGEISILQLPMFSAGRVPLCVGTLCGHACFVRGVHSSCCWVFPPLVLVSPSVAILFYTIRAPTGNNLLPAVCLCDLPGICELSAIPGRTLLLVETAVPHHPTFI